MHNHEKDVLDCEIRHIAQNSWIGEEKKGDLRGVFVHKFKIKSQQYLLAYQKMGPDIELIFLGSHQNYYRDLKQNLKNR